MSLTGYYFIFIGATERSRLDEVINHAVRQSYVSSQMATPVFAHHCAAAVYDKYHETEKVRACLLKSIQEEKRIMNSQLRRKSKKTREREEPYMELLRKVGKGLANEFAEREFQDTLMKERIMSEYGKSEQKEKKDAEFSSRMYGILREIVDLVREVARIDFEKCYGPEDFRYWFYTPTDAKIAHLLDSEVQHQRFFVVHHSSALFCDAATNLFHQYMNDLDLEKETHQLVETLTLQLYSLSLRKIVRSFSQAPKRNFVGRQAEINSDLRSQSGQYAKPTPNELNTVKDQKTAVVYILILVLTNICNLCVETGAPEITNLAGRVALRLIHSWQAQHNAPKSFAKFENYILCFIEEARTVSGWKLGLCAPSEAAPSPERVETKHDGYFSPINIKTNSPKPKRSFGFGPEKSTSKVPAHTMSVYSQPASPGVSPLGATFGARHFLEPVRRVQANSDTELTADSEPSSNQVNVGWNHHPNVSRVTPLLLSWQRAENDMTVDSFRVILNSHSFIQSPSNCAIAFFATTKLPPKPESPSKNGISDSGIQAPSKHSQNHSLFVRSGTRSTAALDLHDKSSLYGMERSNFSKKHLPLMAQRSWLTPKAASVSYSPYYDRQATKELKWRQKRNQNLLTFKFARLAAKKPDDLISSASTVYDEYDEQFPDIIDSLFPDTSRQELIENSVNYISPKAAKELKQKLFHEEFERPSSTRSYSYSPYDAHVVEEGKTEIRRLGTSSGKLKSNETVLYEIRKLAVARLKRFVRAVIFRRRISQWRQFKAGITKLQRIFREKEQKWWPEYFTCDELRTELKALPDGEVYSRQVDLGVVRRPHWVTERVVVENRVLQVTWDDVVGDEYPSLHTRLCLDHRRRNEAVRRQKCLHILQTVFHVEAIHPATHMVTQDSITYDDIKHYGLRSFGTLLQHGVANFNDKYLKNKVNTLLTTMLCAYINEFLFFFFLAIQRDHYENLIIRIQSRVRGWIDRAKANALAPAYRMLSQLPKGKLMETIMYVDISALLRRIIILFDGHLHPVHGLRISIGLSVKLTIITKFSTLLRSGQKMLRIFLHSESA